ncbi:MAG: DoxX family protein [Anaeromyxobacteraceae bacterium]
MLTKELAMVPVRGALGATMLYHGSQKLRADGAAGMGPFFESLGLKPGPRWVRATGLAELASGAGALLGLGTRLAALAILVTQAVAIAKVHGQKGFENAAGGYEFNLLIAAAALGLLVAGPGHVSAHEALERSLEGRPRWRRPRRRGGLLRAVKLLK